MKSAIINRDFIGYIAGKYLDLVHIEYATERSSRSHVQLSQQIYLRDTEVKAFTNIYEYILQRENR